MPDLVKDFEPDFSDPDWVDARKALAASDRTIIAHIDAGLFPHPGLGSTDTKTMPANILMRRGRNFYDPVTGRQKKVPWSYLSKRKDKLAKLTEFPDHGVKTLSVILSDRPEFRGVCPGARIIPYRVSNGPLFRKTTGPFTDDAESTSLIGKAIIHAIDQKPAAAVISISMGNPGWMGPLGGFIIHALGGEAGMARSTGIAINRAYDRGVIICAAAGQVSRDVIYPARFGRTISVAGYENDGQKFTHYPKGGYTSGNAFVDTWARAVGLNRAAGHRNSNGKIVRSWAETEDLDQGDPSGTSYATPFVAAAAAMWVETYADTLNGPAFSGKETAWRRVEAFRHILNTVMPAQQMHSGRPGIDPIVTRPLDLPLLLRTPPDKGFDYQKKPKWGLGFF